MDDMDTMDPSTTLSTVTLLEHVARERESQGEFLAALRAREEACRMREALLIETMFSIAPDFRSVLRDSLSDSVAWSGSRERIRTPRVEGSSLSSESVEGKQSSRLDPPSSRASSLLRAIASLLHSWLDAERELVNSCNAMSMKFLQQGEFRGSYELLQRAESYAVQAFDGANNVRCGTGKILTWLSIATGVYQSESPQEIHPSVTSFFCGAGKAIQDVHLLFPRASWSEDALQLAASDPAIASLVLLERRVFFRMIATTHTNFACFFRRRGKLHAALKFASSALRCEYRCSELGNKSVSTMDESHSDIFLSGSVDDLNDEGDHVSQESQNLIDTRSIEAIPSSGSGKVQSEWHQVSLDTDDPGAIPAVHLNLCAVLSELGRHRAALDHARSAVGILKQLAENELNQALTSGSSSITPGRSLVFVAFHNMAVEWEYLEDWEKACYAYYEALRYAESALGEEDPTTQAIRTSYEQACESLRRKLGRPFELRHLERKNNEKELKNARMKRKKSLTKHKSPSVFGSDKDRDLKAPKPPTSSLSVRGASRLRSVSGTSSSESWKKSRSRIYSSYPANSDVFVPPPMSTPFEQYPLPGSHPPLSTLSKYEPGAESLHDPSSLYSDASLNAREQDRIASQMYENYSGHRLLTHLSDTFGDDVVDSDVVAPGNENSSGVEPGISDNSSSYPSNILPPCSTCVAPSVKHLGSLPGSVYSGPYALPAAPRFSVPYESQLVSSGNQQSVFENGKDTVSCFSNLSVSREHEDSSFQRATQRIVGSSLISSADHLAYVRGGTDASVPHSVQVLQSSARVTSHGLGSPAMRSGLRSLVGEDNSSSAGTIAGSTMTHSPRGSFSGSFSVSGTSNASSAAAAARQAIEDRDEVYGFVMRVGNQLSQMRQTLSSSSTECRNAIPDVKNGNHDDPMDLEYIVNSFGLSTLST